MSKFAARTGDPAAHGGLVGPGCPTVLIGGLPAARQGDPIVCAVHGAGTISFGSTTVWIGGAPAARMGDITGCMTVGVVGIGVPPVIGPPASAAEPVTGSTDGEMIANLDEQNRNYDLGPRAEYTLTDQDQDGNYDTIEDRASLGRRRDVVGGGADDMGFASVTEDIGYIEARGAMSTGDPLARNTTISGGASIEAGAHRRRSVAGVGPTGDGGRNPWLFIENESHLLHGKVAADALNGNDGRRDGQIVSGEAGAEAASMNTTIGFTIPNPFDPGRNWQYRFQMGAAAGTVGENFSARDYRDIQQNRNYLGFSSGLGVGIFGLSFGAEVSYGDKFKPPTPPQAPPSLVPPPINPPSFGIPGTVIMGFPSVMIGG